MHPHDRPLLDTIRWISAALVALGHAIGLVVAPHPLTLDAPLVSALRYIGDLRGACVILFFVLSGYLVGGGVLLRRDRFRWRSYSIARFSRIYIVLVPAILLTLALDGLAWRIAPTSPVYAGIWPPGALGVRAVFDTYGIDNILATLACVAGVVTIPIGSGGPLWSLGHEWIFYFLLPAFAVPLRRWSSWWPTIAAAALVTLLFVLLHRKPTAVFFLIWLMGAAARVLVEHRAVPRWAAVAGAAVAIATFLASGAVAPRPLELLLGGGFALALAYHSPRERGLSRAWDTRLAGFSYSLYVCHLPTMAFLTMLLNRSGALPDGGIVPAGPADAVRVLFLVAALMLPALALAWTFGRLFEDRTGTLRDWLERGVRRPALG